MIRVGFIVLTPDKWTGGTSYFKNLLYATSKLNNKIIQPVLFFATNENRKVVESFEPLGEIVKTDILDQNSFLGFLNAILMRLFNRSFILEDFFRKNQIDVVSHSRFISTDKNITTINWITDFQHLHLPGMFSGFERLYRNIFFSRLVKNSDSVVLSSEDARKDYTKLFNNYERKAKVLQFVSQPSKKIYRIRSTKEIEKKYKFSGKYFYLPNQLWKHKNHIVVLKALNLIKRERKAVLVISTGYLKDYRNRTYADYLLKYVQKNKLENYIKFLGLIDYEDVLTLMRYSISIINPSLFEGWSTSVEEAKSIGKNMILSNIDVHKEQNPPGSLYFDPRSSEELAKILWMKWLSSDGGPDFALEKTAKNTLKKRTIKFAKDYENIVLDITGD